MSDDIKILFQILAYVMCIVFGYIIGQDTLIDDLCNKETYSFCELKTATYHYTLKEVENER